MSRVWPLREVNAFEDELGSAMTNGGGIPRPICADFPDCSYLQTTGMVLTYVRLICNDPIV